MAVYPSITAGQKATADLLRAMVPDVIYKTAATDRASTTVLADDPDLTYQVEANATYHVRFSLWFAALSAADVVTDWTVPVGVTGNRSVLGPGSTVADANADNVAMRCGVHGYGTDVTYSGVRNSGSLHFGVVEESIVQVSTTSGTIAIRWAQGTTNVTATQLAIGSSMTIRRIA